MSNETDFRVALLWHTFGHDNLGVDALSRADEAIVQAAAARLGLKVRCITFGSGQKHEVDDLPATVVIGPAPSLKQILLGKSRFFSELKKCDLVIDIGEGDSFADIYGLRRYLYQIVSKASAIFLRRPIILAPQTVGPFDHPLRRWIASRVINRLTAIFTRDRMSTTFLRSLAPRVPIDEFIDVAFRLPFTQQPKTADRVRIGINVSGLLFNGGYTGANELGMSLDYAALTERLIAHFTAIAGVEVHLFAHVAGHGGPDDDGPVILSLSHRFPSATVHPPFASSIQAKSWISGLDFVIAGRMHACIGAYSAGVPIVPIAYSRKFNGLFGTLNYPYFIDGKATNTDAAFANIVDWYERRVELIAAIEASRPFISQRLSAYEDQIVAILQQLTKKTA
ncbi:polysaccharide pyruvyl transferase family protein [Pannonibacter tanglangensis]|uniref:Polysaccharide pyruvyl transferase family protein n=1 Tax=Pannonibacter tanglangensis TaxID=2750084 RepID=A0ABW9ZC49_9HYPH|nr:polysaccharide pyruvyl transferase family protein [Pannonibacter sp. XCT-34]NBN62397.1 polysaccharide pyruvyl transferase family protein [Pannonibacter sp. XCT-34]